MIPTDQLKFHGTYVKEDVKKDGIGAPLVAVRHLTAEDAAALFMPPAIYYSVTGVVEFEGSRCVLSIHDPLATETMQVEGHTYPSGGEFHRLPGDGAGPGKAAKTWTCPALASGEIRLHRPGCPDGALQSKQSGRALVIHGLMDTPATWVPMLNDLRGDKDIRANYQFWFYSYPSGYPYPYSALILRQELDAIEKKYPLRKQMVLVGHSMGGCISQNADHRPWDETLARCVLENRRSKRRCPRRANVFSRKGSSSNSIGNRPGHFHVDPTSRQRHGQQLDRPNRLDAGQDANEAAHPR